MKYSIYTMFVPYPHMFSELAKTPHMYVLFDYDENTKTTYGLKIQSFKPFLAAKINNFLNLPHDQFQFLKNHSILDLDKIFAVQHKNIKCWSNLLKISNIEIPNLPNLTISSFQKQIIISFNDLLLLNNSLIDD